MAGFYDRQTRGRAGFYGARPGSHMGGRGLGTELIVNGGFGADSDWTKSQPGTAVVTISGGTLNLTGDGANFAGASQAVTTVPGGRYRVVFTVGLNNVNWAVGTSALGSQLGTGAVAPGSYVIYFVATTATSYVGFSRLAATAASVDDVSCRDAG